MPISIQIIVRIVEISSDLPKLVITIHGYFLLPVICARKINILEKIMTEDEKMALATFKFGIISEFVTGVKLGFGDKQRLLVEKSERSYQIPMSKRTKLAALRSCNGFTAIEPPVTRSKV